MIFWGLEGVLMGDLFLLDFFVFVAIFLEGLMIFSFFMYGFERICYRC